MSEDEMFTRNAIAIRISREEAVGMGLVEPTPEEAGERAERARQHDIKRAAAWAVYDAARPALASVSDPVARTVLDLHRSETVESPKCEGCDMDGYDAERPDWPCRTVQAVAEHYGIDLPDPWLIWRRP